MDRQHPRDGDAALTSLLTRDPHRSAALLRAGGVVAIPTETVYGLGACADDEHAVRRVFEIKGRPADHPLIVHLAGIDSLDGWVGDVPAPLGRAIERLSLACWPGPLTMLVPRGRRVIDAVTGGRPTVGLRVPAHPLALELLRLVGTGVAAPSANRFGKVSPTTAQHVLDDIGHLLSPATDAILDGGACDVGVESTIVDLSVSPPQLLRAGAIAAEEIAAIIDLEVTDAAGPSRASGMLAAHYAPTCQVMLAETADEAAHLAQSRRSAGVAVGVLDRTDDLVQAARLLYDDLRHADRTGLDLLIVVVPPPLGLGLALRDRLAKAAAGTLR